MRLSLRKARLVCFLSLLLSFPAAAMAQQPAKDASLKQTLKGSFLIGCSLNTAMVSGQNPLAAELAVKQFNVFTPENATKWESIHPQPGVYSFGDADKMVAFGEANHMAIIGHTLVWHSQTPKWVFKNDAGTTISRNALLARMRDHIYTVVGHYKGRIKGWDVVNEAIAEDGTMRPSPWLRIIGKDYVVKAFQFAHEADPDAELYYTDFSTENAPKRKGAIELIRGLQTQNIKVAAVGMQGHYHMNWPAKEQLDEAITEFSRLGIKVMIPELDINMLPSTAAGHTADVSIRQASDPALNPYPNGLPDAMQQQLANRYAELFSVFMKHRNEINRISFWGVTDQDSWLNNWPIKGRTSYPLLFDRNAQPKPAYFAVMKEINQSLAGAPAQGK